MSAGVTCVCSVYLTSKWYSKPKSGSGEAEADLSVIETKPCKQDPYETEPRRG